MNNLVPFKTTPNITPSYFSDEVCARILGLHRPAYYTVAGLVTAELHKLTRLNNGQVGALYDLKVRNPLTGRTESTRYLYGVDKNGAPKELKRLSTLVK